MEYKEYSLFSQLGDVVDMEDDKGHFLDCVPLYIFNDESFIKILITEHFKIKK